MLGLQERAGNSGINACGSWVSGGPQPIRAGRRIAFAVHKPVWLPRLRDVQRASVEQKAAKLWEATGDPCHKSLVRQICGRQWICRLCV
jgi:hypothetical protein